MKGMKYKPKKAINSSIESKSKPQLDLDNLTEEQINALLEQGITLDQMVQISKEQGKKTPKIISDMMKKQGLNSSNNKNSGVNNSKKKTSKLDKYPSMMDITKYKEYKDDIKKEDKKQSNYQKQNPDVYGYVFSPLINEEILQNMKRTQGSFFVGVNLANLFNTFRGSIVDSEKKAYKHKTQKNLKSNPDSIFNKIGEWIDVDFETEILDKKMGARGSDVPLLPEKKLTNYSTFYEIIDESKKYSDRGFYGKITPYSLLIMTRMLYKYRNNNSQWFRVATVLELIYKYFGGSMSREQYFKSNNEISIRALMDLEEFYNTDHIFMSETEMIKFKADLEFYKYDKTMDVKKQIEKIQKKIEPPI
jgi:hypothetical protein